MLKYFIPSLLYLIPLCCSAQSWDLVGQQTIQKIADYKQKLLTKDTAQAQALSTLLDQWREKVGSEDRLRGLILNVHYSVNVFELGFRSLRKRASKFRADSLSRPLRIRRADVKIIEQNAELLDLILLKVVSSRYPFDLQEAEIPLREIRFFDVREDQHIGEVGAGAGTFALLMGMLDWPLEIYINELERRWLYYIDNKLRNPMLPVDRSRIKLIGGDLAATNFKPQSMDRIIMRNTFHHIREQQRMLESVKKSLKPAGTLCLSEPIKDWKRHQRECKKRLFAFEIRDALQSNGFIIEKEELREGVLYLVCRPREKG